jgi:hypothetical protein
VYIYGLDGDHRCGVKVGVVSVKVSSVAAGIDIVPVWEVTAAPVASTRVTVTVVFFAATASFRTGALTLTCALVAEAFGVHTCSL